jgi:uncharacterized protein YndB with AHSA1/START domain
VALHTNEASIQIARPAPHVFAYLVTSDRRLRWMSALKASEQVTDGPPGVGTRFKDVFEDHGQRLEIDAEVVEYEPHERVAIRLSANAFESVVRQTLAEHDGGTQLTTKIETEYKSALARLMAGVVTGHAQKTLEEDLERLKSVLESG